MIGRRTWNKNWLFVLIVLLVPVIPFLLPSSVSAQTDGEVTRSTDSAEVSPGETVSITITPTGFTDFYAVKEELGDLELVTHTADNYEEGTFVMIQAKPFTYEAKIPDAASPGQQFVITGQWWTDPQDKKPVTPSETVLTVPEPTPTAVPPSPTPDPSPTPTPTPSATPTPTPTAVPTLAAGAQGFRQGPVVRLRPVNDVITSEDDGIIEIFFSNPTVNDVTLSVDVFVSVPSGLHVYGEGFAQSGAAGTVAAHFTVPPGTSRTLFMNIKADKTGSFTIQFSGQYWPGDNKDLFNPISLTHPFVVEEPSPDPLSPEPTNPQQVQPQEPTPTPAPSGGEGVCSASPAIAGVGWTGMVNYALILGPVLGLFMLSRRRRR